MKFDEFLSYIGDFGPYQQRIYTLLCLPIILTGMQLMAPVFILAVPNHRCAIPGLENDTYAITDAHHQTLADWFIPTEGNSSTGKTYSKCTLYKRLVLNETSQDVNATYDKFFNQPEEVPCDKWVYDKSVFTSTVATECNLVCDDSLYVAHATTSVNIGAFFAFCTMGAFSDRFGRKKTYLIALSFLGISSTVSIWLPTVWVFIVTRFLTGFGFGGFFNGSFVYAMEFIGPSKRTSLGIFINIFWGIGLFIHAGLAYGLRNWTYLQLATSLPYFLFFAYCWIIPESPRWLIARGRREEADVVLRKLCKVNHVDLSDPALSKMTGKEEEEGQEGGFFDLFRNGRLALMTVVVYFNWLIVSMVYYGLSLGVGGIGGSIFLNYFLTSLVEFVGYLVCIPALCYVGRKVFHTGSMILAGLALILVIFPEKYSSSDTGILVLSLIGKFGSSAAFATIYLFTAELYPTVIRNTALSTSAVFAALGTFTAPYVIELARGLDDTMSTVVPMLIFGITSVVAGLLALLLPETRNSNLPEKFSDMTKMSQ